MGEAMSKNYFAFWSGTASFICTNRYLQNLIKLSISSPFIYQMEQGSMKKKGFIDKKLESTLLGLPYYRVWRQWFDAGS